MKPRLLDLFCGAGGCSVGYARAGFEVVGVDIEPQPNYPFEFMEADAMALLATAPTPDHPGGWWDAPPFDVIHASPPCQAYSALRGFTDGSYPTLVGPVRQLLRATGLPYVIENVVGAPLNAPIKLCGSSFGLRVWRHRLFEMTHPPALVPPCSHAAHPKPIDVTGTGGPSSKPRKNGGGLSRKPAKRPPPTPYVSHFEPHRCPDCDRMREADRRGMHECPKRDGGCGLSW